MHSPEAMMARYIQEEFVAMLQEKTGWGRQELKLLIAEAIRKAWERLADNMMS